MYVHTASAPLTPVLACLAQLATEMVDLRVFHVPFTNIPGMKVHICFDRHEVHETTRSSLQLPGRADLR
jgi:hypothetical protein